MLFSKVSNKPFPQYSEAQHSAYPNGLWLSLINRNFTYGGTAFVWKFSFHRAEKYVKLASDWRRRKWARRKLPIFNHFLPFRFLRGRRREPHKKNGQVYVKKDDVIIDAEQWYLFSLNKSIARAFFPANAGEKQKWNKYEKYSVNEKWFFLALFPIDKCFHPINFVWKKPACLCLYWRLSPKVCQCQ